MSPWGCWLVVCTLVGTVWGVADLHVYLARGTGRCARETEVLLQRARDLDLTALKMLDSSGKVPAGLLQGNIKSLGHYDECVETAGRYCLASVHVNPRLDTPRGHELHDLIARATAGRADIEITSNRSAAVLSVPDLFPSLALAQLGVCVPSTCGPEDVQKALSLSLQSLARPLGLHASAEITPGACTTLHPAPWERADFTLLVIMGVLLILVIVASYCDLQQSTSSKHSTGWRGVLQTFSAPDNWSRLTRFSTPAPPEELAALDGVRALSTLWVFVSHKAFYVLQQPTLSTAHIVACMRSPVFLVFSNAMPSVHSFFLVSGLLRGQGLLRGGGSFWRDLLRRYLRLTPPFALMVLMYATVLPRLGSGPLWNKVVEVPAAACRENWPSALLYLHNYVHGRKHCMVQTWHLAAEMQLYVVAPLLVLPALRWPRLAPALLGGTLLFATLAHLGFALATGALPTYLVGATDEKLAHYQMSVHFPTHFRLSTYVVGLALALLLHRMAGKNTVINKCLVLLGWCAGLGLLGAVFLGGFSFTQPDYRLSVVEAALYGALQRPAWALGLAWVIFACHTGYGGWVSVLLSWRPLRLLSRLSYSFFLTHLAVMMVHQGSVRGPAHRVEFHLMHEMAGDLVVSLLAALALHLLAEAPAIRLTGLLLGSTRGKVPEQKFGKNGGTLGDRLTKSKGQ